MLVRPKDPRHSVGYFHLCNHCIVMKCAYIWLLVRTDADPFADTR